MAEEEEWLRSYYAERLLKIARDQLPGQKRIWWNRKQRLAACGCYRLVWDLLPDEILQNAVVVAEDYADGKCLEANLEGARLEIIHQAHWLKAVYVQGCIELVEKSSLTAGRSPDRALTYISWFNNLDQKLSTVWANDKVKSQTTREMLHRKASDDGRLHEAGLTMHGVIIRDVFGNPFRPVEFDPSWLTSTAVAIARQMYESRDFTAMPILADALQDAGCDNADILDHCRQPGLHVRGCWVADHVLSNR